MGARRRDRRRRGCATGRRSRTTTPGRGGRRAADELHAPGRPRVAPALKDTSVAEIERRLDALRASSDAALAADERDHAHGLGAARVVEGGGARVARAGPAHPVADDPAPPRSRCEGRAARRRGRPGVLPGPAGHDDLRRGGAASGCAARRAKAPASVVVPLQIPDLPGVPPLARPAAASARPVFEQLVGVSDRLIVDSSEWGGSLPAAYREARASSSVASPSPISPGPARSRSAPGSPSCGRGSRRRRCCRSEARRPSAAPRGVAPLAATPRPPPAPRGGARPARRGRRRAGSRPPAARALGRRHALGRARGVRARPGV